MKRYIAAILVFALVVLLVKVGVDRTAKKSSKSVRLECHKKSTVFEHVYDQALIKEVQRALQKGEFELLSHAKKAQYMKSKLFEYVEMKEVDAMLVNALAAYKDPQAQSTTPVTIDYFVYENDKDDPGKKTKESKRYAGYLHFKVLVGKERIYVIQIDFMDLQGKDIPEKVECAVQSLMAASS